MNVCSSSVCVSVPLKERELFLMIASLYSSEFLRWKLTRGWVGMSKIEEEKVLCREPGDNERTCVLGGCRKLEITEESSR